MSKYSAGTHSFIFAITLFSAVVSVLVGLGMLVGQVIHTLAPSIDFGIATICGLLAIGITGGGAAVLVNTQAYALSQMPQNYEEEDDEDYDDLESEEQFQELTKQLRKAGISQVDIRDGWSRSRPNLRR